MRALRFVLLLAGLFVGIAADTTIQAQILRPVLRARSGFSTALTSAAAPVDSDVQAYEAAAVTAGAAPFTSTRRQLLSDLVAGLKTDGVWAKLDWLVIAAAPDSVAGRYNLRVPSKSLTAVNAPGFTADRGFTGDGGTAYLDSIEFQGTGGQMVPTSAAAGVWINQQNGTALVYELGTTTTSNVIRISARAISGSEQFRVADATDDILQANTGTRTGHRVVSRPSASVKQGYYGAASGSTISQSANLTTAATTLSGMSLLLLRNVNTYSNDRVAATWWGAGLSAAEVSAIHARLSTFLTTIGAN